jgi:hypothetical protein
MTEHAQETEETQEVKNITDAVVSDDADYLADEQKFDEDPKRGSQSEEDVARQRGWKPETEWKGDPPPGGFIESPEDYNRIYEGNHKRLKGEIDEFRAAMGHAQKMLQDQAAELERLRAGQVDTSRAALDKELDDAVQTGDKKRVKQLIEQRERLVEAPKPQAAPESQGQAELEAWAQKVGWYDRGSDKFDSRKAAMADGLAPQLSAKGYSGVALLNEVERQINEAFPTVATPRQPGVEGSRRTASPKPKVKKIEGWSDMPDEKRNDPEVKKIADRLGIGSTIQERRDAYARQWAATYGDQ